MNKIFSSMLTISVLAVGIQAGAASAADNRFPYCTTAASDSDGDGYGWENLQTCLVAPDSSNRYTVSVQNLTYQQVFSPVMAVTHNSGITLLNAGEPASDGIAAIAEGGDTSVLQSALSGVNGVNGVAVSGGPVPYAQSTEFHIDGSHGDVISIVSMLVNTNDAIMYVGSLTLPSSSGESTSAYAVAYDAGTETNDEICAHIPGPACGGVGGSPDDTGEGFVHVHRGLQGVGDLNAATQSWLNPVAKVTITRN